MTRKEYEERKRRLQHGDESALLGEDDIPSWDDLPGEDDLPSEDDTPSWDP